jgi:hypothetical protein
MQGFWEGLGAQTPGVDPAAGCLRFDAGLRGRAEVQGTPRCGPKDRAHLTNATAFHRSGLYGRDCGLTRPAPRALAGMNRPSRAKPVQTTSTPMLRAVPRTELIAA